MPIWHLVGIFSNYDVLQEKSTSSPCQVLLLEQDLFIVYPILLLVTFSYKSCLIALNPPITCVLNLIHPFHTNGSLTWRKCSQFSCIVFLNGINFFLHGTPPTILFHNFFQSKRLMVHIQFSSICALISSRFLILIGDGEMLPGLQINEVPVDDA